MRAVFGVHDEERLARFEGLIDDFARRVGLITAFPPLRRNLGRCSPWARFLRSREALDEFIYEEIAPAPRRGRGRRGARRRALAAARRPRRGRQPMSDEELRDELVTVLGAGHETTATGLAWAIERLLRNPRGAGEAARLARRRRGGLPRRDGQGDAAGAAGDRRRRPQADRAGDDRRLRAAAGHLRAARRSPPSTTARTSSPSRRSSAPSASSTARPTTTPGSPSAAASAAASAPPSPNTRCGSILREFVERAELRAADPKPEKVKVRNITLAPGKGTAWSGCDRAAAA